MALFARIVVLAAWLAMVPFAFCAPTAPQAYSPSRKAARVIDSTRASARSVFAQILTQELSPVSEREGIWRGRVQGAGNVAVALEIIRAGKLEERRLMGKVKLRGDSTWFAFRSWLPSGKNWTWRVVAWVDQPRERPTRPVYLGSTAEKARSVY